MLLEREQQPGYHTTGRSAAIYLETIGPRTVTVMSKVSGTFFHHPPAGFTDTPLIKPLGSMFVANADQIEDLERAFAEFSQLSDTVELIEAERAVSLVPSLDRNYIAAAIYDSSAMDMDVNAIHMGYLRHARAEGLELINNADVLALNYDNSHWQVTTSGGDFAAPIIINAAGAWADVIAELGGVRTIGLVPKRRTAVVFNPPANIDTTTWCAVADCQEQWYLKPDAGQILASPADETPVPPQDVQPEELDVAILIDRLETATTLEIKRINRSWAGLRSFVADKSPIVGFAPDAEGFFWLAGQGGFGIQTSYAMGMTAAALVTGKELPREVADFGIGADALAPQRLWESH